MLMAVIAQLHLPNWYVCSLSFSLSISQFIYHLPLFFSCPCALFPFCYFSVSLRLFLAAAGAMANHLIPNALLRPHGTNNPYNTLLGESAVYNNPLGMYNTQGVQASFHSLTLCLERCVWSWRNREVVPSLFLLGNRKKLYDWRVEVMEEAENASIQP